MDNLYRLLISLNPLRSSTVHKKIIVDYVNRYALSKNPKYPFFKENDCTNFISQCIHEGGARQSYGLFNNSNSWFCSTNSYSDLSKVSLSWRTAQYFRVYWANPHTKSYRAKFYEEITADTAIMDFTNSIYNKLEIGDVVQYINFKKKPYPYHTQVIHRKEVNTDFPYTNLYVAQHSKDRIDVSLHQYIRSIEDRDDTVVLLYKIF